jgi:hypothetical protein
MVRRGLLGVLGLGLLLLAGCISFVGRYDPEYDRSLAQLSDDTARFLGAVKAGKAARSASSDQAVAYYATSYNILDRLAQRATLERGRIPCGQSDDLAALAERPPQLTPLPADYARFDCRETQVYLVRFAVDQLYQAQQSGGTLNASEAVAFGGLLQSQIFVAMQVAVEARP